MSAVVEIENLSKFYRLGAKEKQHDTLMSYFSNAIMSPFNRFNRLRGCESTQENGTSLWALKNVSFDIADGDVVGIIGRNGAGKSTLLKILSRITDPTEGFVKIKGRVASLLEVGTGFHPDLTGRENIYLNGAILGMTQAEIRGKFDEIVDFSEVEKFLDTPVKHYSSGMYVRLAFSVAAHLDPEILVVDEVLAVGDFQFQKKCMKKMESAGKSGQTILFVSHNMAAIRNLCNRAVWLQNGEIAQEGITNEVVNSFLASACLGNDELDVANKPRREKNLPDGMKIIDVKIKNIHTGALNQGETNDDLLIEVSYERKEYDNKFSLEWVFRDPASGQALAYASSSPMGDVIFKPDPNKKTGFVYCHLPKMPFSSGEYILDVALGVPGIKYLDYVENACRFHVIASDPLKTGYRYVKETAPIYIKSYFFDNPSRITDIEAKLSL
jgi:lipopolysaccharide transport system ATP-binding protein